MPTRDPDAAFRVLTRLFLRRLIDNDVISPDADRHETLALVYGLLATLAVFVTFFLCVDYLAAFVQMPGTAALNALSDRFLFIVASIAISAVSALMVWDALALEARDAVILGPLPIAARTITRAKLAAALIFGAAAIVSLNTVPSVVYPALLTIHIKGIGGDALLRLIAVHAMTVTLAGLLGFFGILAIRGSLRLLLGELPFRRASSAVQSGLIVAMITALLLAPTVRARDVRRWAAERATPAWPLDPALWLLSSNEALAGHLVADTPVVLPPRITAARLPIAADRADRAAYHRLLPQFARLAKRAWVLLPIVAAVALATFLWTNRRLPECSGDVAAPTSRLGAALRRIVERRTQNDPEAEAGFFFALQTLTRSAPHRAAMAVGLAVGLTHALVVLIQRSRSDSIAPPNSIGVLAISTGLIIPLLIAVRYCATVPAAPAANWTFRLAWGGDQRCYVAGVERAALLATAAVLLVLLPLHIALLGAQAALVHSMNALLVATAAVKLLFLSYRKLPFACAYVPVENPKLLWPAGLAGVLFTTYGLSHLELWAMTTPARIAATMMVLAGVALFLTKIDAARRREPQWMVFDERPPMTTQRLGLADRIMGRE